MNINDMMKIISQNLDMAVDLRDNANHLKAQTILVLADHITQNLATILSEYEKGGLHE